MRGIDEYYLYVRDNHIRLPYLYEVKNLKPFHIPYDYIFLLPFLKNRMNLDKKVNIRRRLRLEKFLFKLKDEGLVDFHNDTFTFKSHGAYVDFAVAATLWLKSLK